MANLRFGAMNWGRESCSAVKRKESFSLSKVRGRGRKQGERAIGRACTIHCREGIPWVALRWIALLPGVHLEDSTLPLHGQRACQEPWRH